MNESEFQRLTDTVLDHLEVSLMDEGDLSVEYHDGIVRIEFADRSRLVINRHSAARQIWLAAPDGAWHFSCDDSGRVWTDPRSGVDMYVQIDQLIAKRLGRTAGLKPPA